MGRGQVNGQCASPPGRPLKLVGDGHQLSPTFRSPAVMTHHYQMSLTSQLPLVANFSGKLVTTSLEF